MNRPFELHAGPLKFVVYRQANPRWGFIRNIYREVLSESGVGRTIGVALLTGRWAWSLVWRKP